jgi:hypothetical protein
MSVSVLFICPKLPPLKTLNHLTDYRDPIGMKGLPLKANPRTISSTNMAVRNCEVGVTLESLNLRS